MEIKLSDRIQEAKVKWNETTSELNDYKLIELCVDALVRYNRSPEKYPSVDEAEVNKLTEKFERLCSKHEIQLPKFIEWGSIELT